MRTNALMIALTLLASACDEPAGAWSRPAPDDGIAAAHAAPSQADLVARGRYLVTATGCGDCHTPMRMTPNGPAPDASRLLSGHPESLEMPPAPTLPAGPWMATVSASMTAWSGPWGTSFTANLTPDPETGLGRWTPENFIASIRNGRHMGVGRPLLPPMPATVIANYSDDDLRAIFAYLHSIPAVHNRVPHPIPPATANAAPEARTETGG